MCSVGLSVLFGRFSETFNAFSRFSRTFSVFSRTVICSTGPSDLQFCSVGPHTHTMPPHKCTHLKLKCIATDLFSANTAAVLSTNSCNLTARILLGAAVNQLSRAGRAAKLTVGVTGMPCVGMVSCDSQERSMICLAWSDCNRTEGRLAGSPGIFLQETNK